MPRPTLSLLAFLCAFPLAACGSHQRPVRATPPPDYPGAVLVRSGGPSLISGAPTMLLTVTAPPPGVLATIDQAPDQQTVRLVARYEEAAPECPPCPPQAACSACQPPFARFSIAGQPGTFFVRPNVDLTGEPLGARYVLEGSFSPYDHQRLFDACVIARLP